MGASRIQSAAVCSRGRRRRYRQRWLTVQKFDQYGNDKRSTSYLTDRMVSLSTGDEILSAKRLLVRLQGAGAVD